MILGDCKKVIAKSYFQPDGWTANENELLSIVVNKEMEKIPYHVKSRVVEIYRSFIFGNYMAVIALSRCLLEFVIVDRKSLLEKRLNEKVKTTNANGTNKPIRELILIAASAFPELEKGMHYIREQGNRIMHPDKKIVPLEPFVKNLAKHCIDEIQKIIGVLYRA